VGHRVHARHICFVVNTVQLEYETPQRCSFFSSGKIEEAVHFVTKMIFDTMYATLRQAKLVLLAIRTRIPRCRTPIISTPISHVLNPSAPSESRVLHYTGVACVSAFYCHNGDYVAIC